MHPPNSLYLALSLYLFHFFIIIPNTTSSSWSYSKLMIIKKGQINLNNRYEKQYLDDIRLPYQVVLFVPSPYPPSWLSPETSWPLSRHRVWDQKGRFTIVFCCLMRSWSPVWMICSLTLYVLSNTCFLAALVSPSLGLASLRMSGSATFLRLGILVLVLVSISSRLGVFPVLGCGVFR